MLSAAPTDKVDDILYMQLATARIEYERAKVELQISTAKLKIAERKAKAWRGNRQWNQERLRKMDQHRKLEKESKRDS